MKEMTSSCGGVTYSTCTPSAEDSDDAVAVESVLIALSPVARSSATMRTATLMLAAVSPSVMSSGLMPVNKLAKLILKAWSSKFSSVPATVMLRVMLGL